MPEDRRIVRLIKNGPDDSDGFPMHGLGMVLWWRFWATNILVITPLWIGLVVYAYKGGFWGVLAAVLAQTLLNERMMKLNPKYNVTKNY